MSEPAGAPGARTMSGGRIVLLVVGSLLALIGLGMALGGAALLWVHQTQRDADGYFTTATERFTSAGYAVTSQEIDLGADSDDTRWATDLGDLARVRVVGRSADPERSVFLGIGPRRDVEAYLAGVARSEVEDVDFDPFRVQYVQIAGARAPAPPAVQPFWAARAEGTGRQTLEWDVRGGSWTVVVMDAAPARGVAADVQLGLRVDVLLPVAIGLLVAGVVALGSGVTMIAFGARGGGGGSGSAPAGPPAGRSVVGHAGAPAGYPLRIEGELEPDLSRWLWLVKWLFAIPHYVVLVFLWIAFVALTVVAWVAILATGRYPRGIFDFNVGVLRWSWRVAFYSHSALGTDRYPPFTLGDADYPARLDVEYPERLSRGAALVKTWLLAIPHYLVVAVISGGWGLGWSAGWLDGPWLTLGGGLIGLLVVFAAVVLLFTGRYPPEMFALVVGLNRWTYRVVAYAALMRDEYPPFRLDVGGHEAGAPDGGGEFRRA